MRNLAPLSILLSLMLAMSFTSLPIMAHGDTAEPSPALHVDLKVDTHLTARISQPDTHHLRVRFSNGATQQIKLANNDTEDAHYLEAADFNFDGFQDLALVTTEDMVNKGYQIFLFNPADTRLNALQLSSGSNTPIAGCEAFSNLQVKSAERTLYSSCRVGPTWYIDAYRFSSDHHLYLYETQGMLLNAMVPVTGKDGGPRDPARLVKTFDSQGTKIAQQITAYEGGSAYLTIRNERLALHEKPGSPPTQRYLCNGDSVKVDEVSDDEKWLKVEFTPPNKGAIAGWVSLDDMGPTLE